VKFLSVVRSAEDQGPAPQALQDAMARLIADSLQDGSLVQTGGLGASSAGFRVHTAGGKVKVLDGPYAEAKEVIGGYAVLEWASREQAIEGTIAFMEMHRKHWPEWEGECEVRPITFLAP